MISLIVNADDLGINPERDRGILEAFQQGIVTSASLLANGASFKTAVEQVKATGLPIGVHLNLSDGRALNGHINGLTDAQGNLPGKVWMRQHLVAGGCDYGAMRDEFRAQIEQVLHTGLEPDHLDGHQHCQIFPHLTDMIVELAREFDIDAMRSSLPAEPCSTESHDPLAEELNLYLRFAPDAHATIVSGGIKAPQGLWGMPLLHNLNTTSLCLLIENLPQGQWELMAHPGYPYPQGRPFEGAQRQIELQALLSTEAREIITRRRIQLTTFGNLPCAS